MPTSGPGRPTGGAGGATSGGDCEVFHRVVSLCFSDPFMDKVLLVALTLSGTAHAFCGFFVARAEASLINPVTTVVLMREGTRTVLSMENAYVGPPEEFALVVPVPVVLTRENLRVVPAHLFRQLDALTSPRLVEYWEQNPCPTEHGALSGLDLGGSARVRVESKFEFAKYDITILSAADSMGLVQWLRDERYRLPDGAEAMLQPFIQQGLKFFVARVNPSRLTFTGGRATLTPLRMHFDAEQLSLPIRLGLLNAAGPQELIIHVLARGQRFEVANAPNLTIPTNLDLRPEAQAHFPAFYAALLERAFARTPKPVVTEYAWDVSACDPCAGKALSDDDLAALGADVLPVLRNRRTPRAFVVTRLHARFSRETAPDDLILRAAPPISGGREAFPKDGGGLDQGARPASTNTFQARYAIRRPWTGDAGCPTPVWGAWGGRTSGGAVENVDPSGKLIKPRPSADGGARALEESVESAIDAFGVPGQKPFAGLPLPR
jgi:hypothetical protein